MSGKALFLDRDGVLDELVYYPSHDEWESPRSVDRLRFLPGVFESLRAARAAGWELCLMTNQPSWAKQKVSRESLEEVQRAVLASLREERIDLLVVQICFHHPEAVDPTLRVCECRKPSPKFLIDTAAAHDLVLSESWMVGDQASDVECGRRAGCKTALLEYEHSRSKRGAVTADLVCADLPEFIRTITRGTGHASDSAHPSLR